MTIRDLITGYQNELAKGDLLPERAADILTELSALVGNCLEEIRKWDLAYNQKLLACYEQEEKANRAKIKAQVSEEYQNLRIAKDTYVLVTEMIKSLKYYLKAKEQEYRSTY